jgi:hypothetical protein
MVDGGEGVAVCVVDVTLLVGVEKCVGVGVVVEVVGEEGDDGAPEAGSLSGGFRMRALPVTMAKEIIHRRVRFEDCDQRHGESERVWTCAGKLNRAMLYILQRQFMMG